MNSIVENHLEILEIDDRDDLKKELQKRNLLRFNMQVTYDLYGSSPIHWALRPVVKIEFAKETDEELD